MIPWADAVSMLVLGLLGTAHCLGMCGPLVLALPAGASGHLGYHLGRVITYTALGALAAGLGAGLRLLAAAGGADPLGAVSRLQVIVSLVAALVLLALGLARLGVIKEPPLLSVAGTGRIPGLRWLRRRATDEATGRRRVLPLVGLGTLLGFLPCCLSYGAFARALAAPGPLEGALLALAFGLGTVPGLLVLGTGAAAVVRSHQRLADLLAGVLLLGMAASIGIDAARSLG
jgi:sulfite exporter TauE/SafE